MKRLLAEGVRFLLLPVAAVLFSVPVFRRHVEFLLSTWKKPERRSAYHRLVYPSVLLFWTRFVYRRERNPDRREALQALVWAQGSGDAVARYWDSVEVDEQLSRKIGDSTYEERVPLLRYLDELLTFAEGEITVCQIGSSSGREIGWLATRHPGHVYIGFDISPDAVTYATVRYPLPNLTFQVASAKDIGSLLPPPDSGLQVVVFSHGCLQHVQPEHAARFFVILGRMPNLRVALAEPVNCEKPSIEGIDGSRPRGSVSYSHNYRFYAERAGFTTEHSHISGQSGAKKATYIYWGRSLARARGSR